jgi:hypothetical protein
MGTSLDVGGASSANRPNRLKAVNDYLTRIWDGSGGPDGPSTLQVAQNIDAAIAKNFVSEQYTALLILMLNILLGRNKCNSCQFVEEGT